MKKVILGFVLGVSLSSVGGYYGNEIKIRAWTEKQINEVVQDFVEHKCRVTEHERIEC